MKKIKKFDKFLNEKLSDETMLSYANKIKEFQPKKAREVKDYIYKRNNDARRKLLTGDPNWDEPIRLYIKGNRENLNVLIKLGVISEDYILGKFLSEYLTARFDGYNIDDGEFLFVNMSIKIGEGNMEYLNLNFKFVIESGIIKPEVELYYEYDGDKGYYDGELKFRFVSRKDMSNLLKHIKINATEDDLNEGIEDLKIDMSRENWGK
jgi:hypothetical protein